MTAVEHDIVAQVYAAKEDSDAADQFIQQYLPFIRSETAKFVGAAPDHRYEDELSVAMLAFYEAILGYARTRGAFLPYAARAIKNRLIDYTRKEKRHQNVVSLHTPYGEEERTLEDTLPAQNGLMEEYDLRQASQQEIQEFGAQQPQAGTDLNRLPPCVGLRPADPPPVGPLSGDPTPPHQGALPGRWGGQKDPRATPSLSGGHPPGLHQRL